MSLVKAIRDSGTLGTEFVFAVPSANRLSLPPYDIWTDIFAQNLTNATIFTRIGKNESFPKFLVFGLLMNSDLVPRPPGIGIFDIGVRIKTGNLSAVKVSLWDDTDQSIVDGEGTFVYSTDTLGADYITNGANLQACSVVATRDSTNVALIFPNGTRKTFKLDDLQALFFFVDSSTFGTRIKANLPIAVFLGTDCNNKKSNVNCTYLWEQAVSIENFGVNYTFVDPTPKKSSSYQTKLHLVNGANYTVKVNISGITGVSPILLAPGSKVQVDAKNLTHFIRADGPIDVQIQPYFSTYNTSLISLIPNNQFVKKAIFNSRDTNSNLFFVALTDDVKNAKNSLKFDEDVFDLKTFEPTADPFYSFAVVNWLKRPIVRMDSTFGLAGYLVSYQTYISGPSSSNFGSIIGRNLSCLHTELLN